MIQDLSFDSASIRNAISRYFISQNSNLIKWAYDDVDTKLNLRSVKYVFNKRPQFYFTQLKAEQNILKEKSQTILYAADFHKFMLEVNYSGLYSKASELPGKGAAKWKWSINRRHYKKTHWYHYSYSGQDHTVQPYLVAARVGQVPHSLICLCGSDGRFVCAIPGFLIPPAKCQM